MRDLASSTTFKKESHDQQVYLDNRVITSDQINAKSKQIDAWLAEQEQTKVGVSMDVSDYQNASDLQNAQRQEDMMKNYNSAKKSDYQQLVEDIQKSMQPKRSKVRPQMDNFGLNSNNNINRVDEVKPPMYWFQTAQWGRELNNLEDKEPINDEQPKKRSMFQRNMPQKFEKKETNDEKTIRLKIEQWKPLLFTGQISLATSVVGGLFSILGVHPLWTNPFVLLGFGLASLGFSAFKLKSFNDGPLNGNFLFSDKLLNKSMQEVEQQLNDKTNEEKQKFEAEEKKKQERQERRKRLMERQNNSDLIKPLDDDFDDDDDEDISETQSVVKTQEQDENDFPKAWGSADSKEELYHTEERFLKYVWEQRNKVNLRKPIDILNFFAPMIVSYNKKFANIDTISRDSWEFKNIAYAIGKTYGEIDKSFAKYNKHQKEYYYAIDEITRTDLYYKIKITLPVSIGAEQFNANIGKLKNILKASPDDSYVDAFAELGGKSGYIKIMRINNKGFVPAVSTGDVLRFKGMKTTNGKDLIEELSSPGDLKLLVGLHNAENALVFDVAGKQNTNITVQGFTGSGKTVSTSSWLMNILVTHSPEDVGFIILDPKNGSAWNAFKYTPHVLGYFGKEDLEKWPAITDMLRQVSTARQNYQNNVIREENYFEARKLFSSQEDWDQLMKVPRLFVVYDEMLDTLSGLNTLDMMRKEENKSLDKADKKYATSKDTFKASLGGLANVTRESGITLMALSQRSDDNSLPRTYLSSSSIKFVMKVQFQSDAVRILNTDKIPAMEQLPTGTGYLQANGLKLSQLNTPLFSGNPDFNVEVMKTIGIAWSMLYSVHHDMSKLPEHFLLQEAKTNPSYGIDSFSLFNRNKQFDKMKQELLTGDVHYKKVDTDLSFDFDAPTNYQESKSKRKLIDVEENDVNQEMQTQSVHQKLSHNLQDALQKSAHSQNVQTNQTIDDYDEENVFDEENMREFEQYQSEQHQNSFSDEKSQQNQSLNGIQRPSSNNNQTLNSEPEGDTQKSNNSLLAQLMNNNNQELNQNDNSQQEQQKAIFRNPEKEKQTIQNIMNDPFKDIKSDNRAKYYEIQKFMIDHQITSISQDELSMHFNSQMIDAAIRNNIIKQSIDGSFKLMRKN